MRDDLIDRIFRDNESRESPLLKLLIEQINETVRLAYNGGGPQARPFANRLNDRDENSVKKKPASQSDWSPRF